MPAVIQAIQSVPHRKFTYPALPFPLSLHSRSGFAEVWDGGISCEQKALKEKGIDEILEEARESNRENDLEHLKRGCELFFPPCLISFFFVLGRGYLTGRVWMVLMGVHM